MNNPLRSMCRNPACLKPKSTSSAQPRTQPTPPHQTKASPIQQGPSAGQGGKNEKGCDGLPKADTDWFLQLESKKLLNPQNTDSLDLPGLDPMAATRAKQLRCTIANLENLPDPDQETIDLCQKELDKLTANKSAVADSRDAGRIHGMLATLKRSRASAVEKADKDLAAAKQAAEFANKQLGVATTHQAEVGGQYDKKVARLEKMLNILGKPCDQEPSSAAENPLPAPQVLQPLLANMVQKVREENGLIGTDTPELNAVQHFCVKFLDELSQPTAFQPSPTDTLPDPSVALGCMDFTSGSLDSSVALRPSATSSATLSSSANVWDMPVDGGTQGLDAPGDEEAFPW